jgi:hypothetical protein
MFLKNKPKKARPTLELSKTERELRQRDTEWRATAPLGIALLAGVSISLGLLSLFLPKPVISEYENRRLQEKPAFSLQKLFTGELANEWDLYYSDTFPARETFVRAAGRIQESLGLRLDDVRIHDSGNQPANEDPIALPPSSDNRGSSRPEPPAVSRPELPAASQPEAAETPPAASSENEEALWERQGPIFIYKGEGLSIFSASESMSAYYAQTLNQWQQRMGENVTIYNLIVPTHIEFALPERYRSVTSPQKPNIDSIYSQLDPRIKAVDAYSALESHRDEYLYFRTDHHWTGLGAYYAYTAFCESAGLTPMPLEKMEKKTLTDFVGTLYKEAQDSQMLKNPDYVDYWLTPIPHTVLQYRRGSPFYGVPSTLLGEYASGSNSYSVFLHGDYPLTKIVTEQKNGRKIAVVKESFGNAFSPFLVNNYQEVYVVDQRYFELNLPAFLEENGIQELLFINNIFAANTRVRINETARLMTQVWSPPAPSEPEPEPEPEPKPKASSRVEFDPWAEDKKDW